MLKKKPTRRMEKERKNGSKSNNPKPEIPSKIIEMQSNFEAYITENRMLSVISKEGKPKSKKEIGNYVRFMIEDAKDDFMKDYPQSRDLSINEWKTITSGSGNLIRSLIFPHIQCDL